MKILITTDWYAPTVNGVVTSVLNLKKELAAAGHDVRVLTLSGGIKSHRDGDVTYIGSIGVGRIYPNARMKVAFSGPYIREIIEWKPDIVHSQCEFSTFFMARRIARECGCPLIHTYHTIYEDYTNYFSPNRRVGRFAAARFSSWIIRQTSAVIAPTAKVVSLLRGYGVRRPVYAVPTGLDLSKFQRRMTEEERRALRRSLGIAESDWVLVFLGRLAKEKNVTEVLEDYRSWLDRNGEPEDVKLVLVGDGPYRPEIEAEARALCLDGRVVLTGMIDPDETWKYYGIGDVFVCASQSEAQGLTYIEAMACGLPLLCWRDQALEGVLEEGINGFAFESAAEFSKGLSALLENPAGRREMGEASRRAAGEKFSAQAFAARIVEIYRICVRADARRARLMKALRKAA